jgi:hypothetical protein
MERMLFRWKILFFLFVLLLLFGCSYNAAYTPQLSPRGGVDCSKFTSEYTEQERRVCGPSN